MALAQKAFKSIRWNIVSTFVLAIGSLLQLYLLVRYIEKSDFGLMAMVNVVIAFVMIFLDLGVSNGIIYKKEVNPDQLSTLYWFNVFTGIFLSIVIFLLSHLVAYFYNEPGLTSLLQALSLVFFINGLGVQFKVLLTKELKFDLLAKINIVSFLFSFITTVSLAIKGFGVYSLAAGLVVKVSTEMIMSVFFGVAIFRPTAIFDVKSIRFFLRFGSFQMGERFLNFFNSQIDVILIGKFLGAETLGVYDILKQFLMRPFKMLNPIITSVSFPLMSKIQDNETKLINVYLKQLNYICSLNFPIYLFLFFNAKDILQFMFGLEWTSYESLFRFLSLYFIIYCTGNPVGTLLLSKGRPDLGFYWNLAVVMILPLTIFFGLSWGLKGVVIALFVMQLLLFIPNYIFLVRKLISVPFDSYFKNMLQPFFLATIASVFTYFISQIISLILFVKLAMLIIFAGIIYLLLCIQFNRPFVADLKTLMKF